MNDNNFTVGCLPKWTKILFKLKLVDLTACHFFVAKNFRCQFLKFEEKLSFS